MPDKDPLMSFTITRPKLAALLSVPALVLALAACASPAPDPGSSHPGTSDGAAESMSFADWQLANAECMRDQGVDMPDLSEGGSTVAIGPNDDLDAIQAASEVCAEKLGPPPELSDEEKADMDATLQKLMLEVAECYRANGVDVPDPGPGEQLTLPMDVPQDVSDECGGGAAAVPATKGE
jgi:hypothetical protein